MKYWEFLIQKEGDDTWLPLETQQVEILEGRYRVVAHTDRVNEPIEIRVSQLVTDEMPPRKRVRKRTSTISDSGLVVVMPFVHLKPGQWNLRCSSVNVMDDFMGQSWQYNVELQVFAQTDEDWSGEWPVPTDAESANSSLVEVDDAEASQSVDHPLIQAQAKLQEQRQSQMADGTNHSSNNGSPNGESATGFDNHTFDNHTFDNRASEAAYHIYLKQQAFLARPNQAMTIMGQVQALVTLSPEETASQLWLRLQNPETGEVIMEAHRPLSLARLPADFKVKIQLPGNVTTRVVLGEVSLRSPAADSAQPAKILSSSAFTITAGIAQLLDDLANQDPGLFDDEVSVPADLNGADKTSPTLAVPLLDPTHKPTTPAVGVVLPPQLVRPLEDADYRVSTQADWHADSQHDQQATDQQATDQQSEDSQSSEDIQSEGSPFEASQVEDIQSEDSQFEDSQPEDQAVASQPPSQLDLPTFPSYSAVASGDVAPAVQPDEQADHQLPPMVVQPAQFMGTSIEDDDLEASQIAALLDDIDGDLTADTPIADTLEPPGIEGALPDLESEPDTAQENPAAIPSRLSRKPKNRFHEKNERQAEVSAAFQSLKRKDRFWDRLSNLTHESRQESADLAANMKAAGVDPKARVSDRTGAPITPTNQPANSEVVIFDQPDAVPQRAKKRRRPAAEIAAEIGRAQISGNVNDQPAVSGVGQSAVPTAGQNGLPAATSFDAEPAASAPAYPPEDLPEMALPVISVPVGDLVAGSTVTVIVRTRPSLYKPFIKLWMIDRQSRTLVGDPQLLTNLRPDALGDLETSTNLQVPMGCLDVQIAAIAVDMATQQESNKAIVNRHVVPANQPRSSLRGLNF